MFILHTTFDFSIPLIMSATVALELIDESLNDLKFTQSALQTMSPVNPPPEDADQLPQKKSSEGSPDVSTPSKTELTADPMDTMLSWRKKTIAGLIVMANFVTVRHPHNPTAASPDVHLSFCNSEPVSAPACQSPNH